MRRRTEGSAHPGDPRHEGGADTSAPGICATICTHDRPVQLERALRSLLAQRVPPDEILIVDNAPSDDRARALVREKFSAARYVAESIPGLDFARNRALRTTAQPVVAFTDDDAVADKEWIARIGQAFLEQPGAVVCTGRVDPLALETEGQRLFEANGGLASPGRERLRLPADEPRLGWRRYQPYVAWAARIGNGCNLAVRRDFALSLGGFDEALDLGAALPGGGDTDFLWRVLEAGGSVVYEPEALVRHEHRRERDAVVDQILGHQRGLIASLTKAVLRGRGRRRAPALAFLCWRLLKPGVRLVRRALGRDPLPASLLLRIWWHCWRGLGAYAIGERVARERRQGSFS